MVPLLSRRDFLKISAAGIAAAALPLPSVLGESRKTGSFTWAGINDLHIKNQDCLPYISRVVAALNDNPAVSGVVVLGDLATMAQPEELRLAREALKPLNKPCYILPGNHDIGPETEGALKRFNDIIGPEHWLLEWEHWTFLGFNSCVGAKSDVILPESEINWLRDQLISIDSERPLALFCHHPLNPHSKAYRIINGDEILDLFSHHALRLVSSGHWHGNQEESTAQHLFTTTACCSSTRDNFDKTAAKGYRLFHFGEDRADTEFVEVR